MSERSTAFKHIAYSSAATYIEYALGLATSIVIARALGPEAFGQYAFVIWLSGWLMKACNHALTTTAIKFIAEARGAHEEALAAAIGRRLWRLQQWSSLAVLSLFAAAALIASPVEWGRQAVLVTVTTAVAVYTRSAFWMLGAIGKGHERFEIENLTLLIGAVANVALVLGWSLLRGSWIGFLMIYATTGIILLVFVKLMSRRARVSTRPGQIPAPIEARVHRQLSLGFVLIVIALAGNRTIESALLKAFSDARDFAFFTLAGTLTRGAVDFLATGLSAVLLPAMSRATGRNGMAGLAAVATESIRYYWLIGLAVAGLGVIAVPGAVETLYGASYAGAIPAIIVSLVAGGLTTPSGALSAFQTAAEFQGDRIRVMLMSLVVNAVAAACLVPLFGLHGAIASAAVTSAAFLLLSWWQVRRRAELTLPVEAMARNAVAAIGAGTLALAMMSLMPWRWSFVPGALLFLALYFVATALLKGLHPADYDLISRLFARLGHRGERLVGLCAWLKENRAAGP